jgi:hypothetical protein
LRLLNGIQARLTELHDGSDVELRQQIAVLEDERDRELLEVEAARGFALERIEREYQEEKRLADKEYQVYIAIPIPSYRIPFYLRGSSCFVSTFPCPWCMFAILTLRRSAEKKEKTNS